MSDNFVVRAVNVGAHDIPISHDRQLLVVPAGGDRVVPWNAMVSLWGDPATSDDANQTRVQVGLHLRGHFGWFAGLDDEPTWETRRPKIEWYTLDGARIWTVLDDPTGEKAAAANTDPVGASAPDAPFLADQIRQLEARLQQLQDALEQRNTAAAEAAAAQPELADTGELPVPDPTEAPVKTDTPTGPRIRGK